MLCRLIFKKHLNLHCMILQSNCCKVSSSHRWIMVCLKSAYFSVCVHGESQGFCKGETGVREGDQMSPLIFMLIEEVFNRILNLKYKIRNSGFHYHSRRQSLKLCSLFFFLTIYSYFAKLSAQHLNVSWMVSLSLPVHEEWRLIFTNYKWLCQEVKPGLRRNCWQPQVPLKPSFLSGPWVRITTSRLLSSMCQLQADWIKTWGSRNLP